MGFEKLNRQNIYPINAALLDNKILYKDHQEAVIPDVKIKSLKNALITPTNLVFVNGKCIPISINFHQEIVAIPSYRKLYIYLKYRFVKNVVEHKDGLHLFAYDIYSSNYYHWLCEVLPRLIMMRDEHPDGVIILPDELMHYSFITTSLKLLDLNYVAIDNKKSHYFNRLVFIDTKPSWANVVPGMLFKTIERIFTALKISAGSDSRKVYISRAKAAYRKFTNEAEILPYLEEYGYEVVYAEELSFIEQVKLFSQTGSLIAMHGGGLTNLMFMPKHSKIIEIRSKGLDINPLCYWRLANILDMQWNYFEANIVGKGTNFEDITLDVPLFAEFLKKLNT